MFWEPYSTFGLRVPQSAVKVPNYAILVLFVWYPYSTFGSRAPQGTAKVTKKQTTFAFLGTLAALVVFGETQTGAKQTKPHVPQT